ncbi:DUF943 family protein [Siccibacter colletis]|uniref:DUF943 family protein n=1 Tax=Siccibacter colletis TaxID=1505757 RepID=UPI003CF1D0D2
MRGSFKFAAIFVSLLVVIVVLCFYFRKTTIIDIFTHRDVSDIVVSCFPLTSQGKISWWSGHQQELKARYKVPHADRPYGTWTIRFWDIGSGYQALQARNDNLFDFSENEQFCFSEIKYENRCVNKRVLLEVSRSMDGIVTLTAGDNYYRQQTNGEIIVSSAP